MWILLVSGLKSLKLPKQNMFQIQIVSAKQSEGTTFASQNNCSSLETGSRPMILLMNVIRVLSLNKKLKKSVNSMQLRVLEYITYVIHEAQQIITSKELSEADLPVSINYNRYFPVSCE